MRRPGEVHQKFKQVLYRHRKRAIEAVLRRVPRNCVHNCASPLHPSVDPDGTPFQVRVCGNAAAGLCGVVCDSDHGGDVVAQQCVHFVPLRTPAQVKEEFQQLVTQSPAALAARYPDLAALAWVIKDPVEVSEEDEVEDVAQELHDPPGPRVPPEPVALAPVEPAGPLLPTTDRSRWLDLWRRLLRALGRLPLPWR